MKRSFLLKIHDPDHMLPAGGEALSLLKTAQAGQTCFAGTLGWHCVEEWAGEERLTDYCALADKVCRDADAMVVIGIGGSNQGARAVIDALARRAARPEIIWVGNTISPHSMLNVLEKLKQKKSVYINVIAKNFETLEPGIGFRVLRQYLRQTYGPGWEKRVIATGTQGSHLEQLCIRHGFHFLPFPEDIGGRFTVLSPVGLFPMAVAGVDIRELGHGALDMERALKTDCSENNPALVYARARNSLYATGRRIEMLAFFEPRLFRFSKWWVQLFGESEGKDGKGLYPVAASYSEDLHSIGQFVQEGTPCLFETFLNIRRQDVSLPLCPDYLEDGFDYLDGVDMDAVNRAAFQATLEAHSSVFPCVELTVDQLDEYAFGQMFYFFQFACYLSGLLLGVNPFDQPGVEDYKKRMFQKLGKK